MSELKPRITENRIDYILVGIRYNKLRKFRNSLQIKSQAPKWTWKKKNMQAVGRKKRNTKRPPQCADLKGQIADSYSV